MFQTKKGNIEPKRSWQEEVINILERRWNTSQSSWNMNSKMGMEQICKCREMNAPCIFIYAFYYGYVPHKIIQPSNERKIYFLHWMEDKEWTRWIHCLLRSENYLVQLKKSTQYGSMIWLSFVPFCLSHGCFRKKKLFQNTFGSLSLYCTAET